MNNFLNLNSIEEKISTIKCQPNNNNKDILAKIETKTLMKGYDK